MVGGIRCAVGQAKINGCAFAVLQSPNEIQVVDCTCTFVDTGGAGQSPNRKIIIGDCCCCRIGRCIDCDIRIARCDRR